MFTSHIYIAQHKVLRIYVDAKLLPDDLICIEMNQIL